MRFDTKKAWKELLHLQIEVKIPLFDKRLLMNIGNALGVQNTPSHAK